MFSAAVRAAAVDLLKDYAASAGVKLQVYPGRPASLHPPTAFVDRIPESVEYNGHLMQRRPRADVLVLFGDFDSKEAVTQRDAFVDGFLAWVRENFGAAGANTTLGLVSMEDEPTWTPDWMPRQQETFRSYYAVRLTLEGYAEE